MKNVYKQGCMLHEAAYGAYDNGGVGQRMYFKTESQKSSGKCRKIFKGLVMSEEDDKIIPNKKICAN
ncbi:MAG: hypothetical protein MJ116_09905 [Lachnospiraceae bacterium]|nr:hypothetical protein [Lachnospiraceae bacterium]